MQALWTDTVTDLGVDVLSRGLPCCSLGALASGRFKEQSPVVTTTVSGDTGRPTGGRSSLLSVADGDGGGVEEEETSVRNPSWSE